MGKTGKRIFNCLGVLFLTVAALWGLSECVQRKASDIKFHDFFEQEGDFDILFLGTSHMLNGVFPMELWKDHGFISYNLGSHGSFVPTEYWALKMAMDYTMPKLVVIDTYMVNDDEKAKADFSFVHFAFDAFPLTATKYQAVQDLLDDEETEKSIRDGIAQQAEKRDPIALLWDFSVYHSRWAELGKEDFSMQPSPEKGADSRIRVALPQETELVSPQDKWMGESVGTQYLRRLIEECKSKGIEVLLVYLPFPANSDQQREANRLPDIAAECGVDYINFLKMDVVDLDTDCYDPASHLNPSGARKVTDYLGQYIAEHYDIPDRRQDPAYSGWYDDYETYARFKESNIRAQTDLDTYLMLLADKNYDIVFYLKDCEFLEDSIYVELLKNLGIDTSVLEKADSWLITRRGGQAAQMWPVPAGGTGTWDTALGKLQLCNSEVTIDGTLCMVRPAEETLNCLQSAVLAPEDHRLIDTAKFDLKVLAPQR